MESTLKNMVLVLFTITLISAISVGGVYVVTIEPIAKAKAAKVEVALTGVLPKGELSNMPIDESKIIMIDDMAIIVYPAMCDGNILGYAVETMTKIGYSGEFKLMVGFNAEMEIENIVVLQHKETPGLGSKIGDSKNVLLVSFQGKNPSNMKLSVTKDGGEVDAITASTITSRAYVDAVSRAHKAVLSFKKGE